MLRNASKLLLPLLALALLLAPGRAAAQAASTGPTGTNDLVVRGDVNGDGQVTVLDALAVLAYVVGKDLPADYQLMPNADANGDGQVTALDALVIAGYAMGKDVSRFPVGAAVQGSRTDALDCTADARALTVTCRSQRPGLPAGAHGLIVGGQNVYLKLTNTNNAFDAGTGIFSTDVRVTNLIPQPLGVDTLGAVDPAGIRVFHNVLTPSSVTVANADGTDAFLAPDQSYFQYAGGLATGDSTAAKSWHWHLPAGVTSFNFKVYVSAAVQKPNGWVDIYPKTDTLTTIGATVALEDTVRNPVGNPVSGQSVTWSSSNTAVATVDPSTGVVTAVGDGTTTITAQTANPHRSGTATIVVTVPSAAHTTITPAPGTLSAGDTSTLTVQVKNSAGVNITHGGSTVVLSASAGTLVAGATSGASVTATDNGNGTYTARLTATAAGTVLVSGTLDGIAIGDTASVVFGPSTPANMVKSAGDGQSATVNTNVATAPAVTITDAHGNPVPGVSVTFAVGSGGGSVTGGSATTNASGVATVGSWKLGTTAGANTLTASSTGLTTVTFSATGTPGAPANITKSAGDGQSATVNTAVTTAPAVTVTDAFSNVVPGVTVTFAPASGGGSVTGATPSTNASGVATVGSWKLGTTAGANTLTATAGALSTTFSATATPDVPASITKTAGDLQNGTVGAAVATPPAVHVADQYGNPVPGATITFAVTGGGGSTTVASPLTDASGNAAVGSWTLGAGPTTNTLQASANPAGTSSPVTFTAYVPPTAGTDVSQAMGNTTLPSNVAPNVLANDATINGGSLTLTTTGAIATVRGGSVTLAADGTFSYLPAAGVTGRDSVQYTINDGHLSATGWIKFAFIGKVWYVDNTFGGTATGRDVSPYTSVSAAEAAAGVNDTILVRTGSGTTAGGTLKNGQTLRGQGQNAAFTASINSQTVTLLATGTAPHVGALTLGSGNALRGFRVFNASGGGLTGASIGTLSLGEMSIGVTGGPALDLTTGTVTGNGGTGAAVLDSLRSTNSSSTGLALNGVAGTLTINGGTASAITNPTGSAVSINGSSPTLTFPGTISKTNGAGTGINLTSTGATVSFTGPSVVLSTGSGTGINMSSATGTVSFVDSVKVTTTSGSGISATTSGTLTIQGTHNSISSGSGTALNVSNTTIGAAGLTFRSISASGGSNGIVLSSTGNSGGLTVTGDGATNGSGGTISNTTGADGATAGNGVYLSSARNVSLSWMAFSGHANNGIYGSSVRGSFTLNHMRFTGTNGTSASGTYDESPVHLVDAGGAIKMTNSRFDGGAYNAVLVENISGTAPAIDSLVIDTDTVTSMQGSTSDVRSTALLVNLSDGTADVRIRNNLVTAWWGNGIHVLSQGTASSTARITGNTVDNQNGALAGAGGIWVGGGNLAYNISSNVVKHTNGTAISAGRTNQGTNMNGTIANNTIGVSGDTNSGSGTGIAIFAEHHGSGVTTVRIASNVIRQIAGSANGAITTHLGDDVGYGASGTLNATVTGNDIAETGSPTNNAQQGMFFEAGAVTGDTDAMCLDVGGAGALANKIANFNTTAPSTSQNRIRVNQRFSTSVKLPGYTGAGSDAAAVQTYILGRNTISNALAQTTSSTFGNTSPAGSACPQPSM